MADQPPPAATAAASPTVSPTDANYWTYWVHKLQELWKRMEDLEERMDVADRSARQAAPAAAAAAAVSAAPAKPAEQEDESEPLTERELTVCMALKEIDKSSTLDQVNSYLKATRRIDEGLRDTLLNRLKGAVEKGYVGYNEADKTFILVKRTFVVQ